MVCYTCAVWHTNNGVLSTLIFKLCKSHSIECVKHTIFGVLCTLLLVCLVHHSSITLTQHTMLYYMQTPHACIHAVSDTVDQCFKCNSNINFYKDKYK